MYLSAAAAKSLQLCPTLCDPTDGRPSGSPVPGILQARTLEWVSLYLLESKVSSQKFFSLIAVAFLTKLTVQICIKKCQGPEITNSAPCGSHSADTCVGEFCPLTTASTDAVLARNVTVVTIPLSWLNLVWSPNSGVSTQRLNWVNQILAPRNLNEDIPRVTMNTGELICKVSYRKGWCWHRREPESCAVSNCGAAETRALQREHVRREEQTYREKQCRVRQPRRETERLLDNLQVCSGLAFCPQQLRPCPVCGRTLSTEEWIKTMWYTYTITTQA